MERRKFIIGAGSLAAGGAAALGSGAFTSVEADRSVDVEVAGDSAAYLALSGTGSDNSNAYVDDSGSEVSFDFSSSNNTGNLGDGFNVNAVTTVDDLLEVQNQGTQSAFLSVDLADLDISDGQGNNAYVGLEVVDSNGNVVNANIAYDSSGSAAGGAVPPSSNDGSYDLAAGESVTLNLVVDTTDFQASNVSTSGSVTFIADQDSSL